MRNAGPSSEPVRKAWSRPELVRLGRIEDVAGSNPTPRQNANNS
jgi:hypothetical protein